MNKKTTKSRGGQPGNLNALKHGYYSRYMDLDPHDNRNCINTDVTLYREIGLLRTLVKRSIDRISDNIDGDGWINEYLFISQLALRVGQLVTMQSKIQFRGEAISPIKEIIQQAAEELGINKKDSDNL